MVRNHCLAKAISDAGWSMFGTMLKYKAEAEGKVYLEIDRFFPSSKTCNHCLFKVSEMNLKIRQWKCPKCDAVNDRDREHLNYAISRNTYNGNMQELCKM